MALRDLQDIFVGMKWLDDIRDGAEAFKAWAKTLTIICAVIAIAVVAIAIELLIVCCKL